MTSIEPIRVYAVDSQPVVHAGIRALTRPFTDITIVGEAYDAADLLHFLERHAVAVILVEIEDLGRDWADTLRRARRLSPGVSIVVFTGGAEPACVQEALACGARGYLLKRASALTLATAIRSAAIGQQVLAPEAAQALLTPDDDEAMPRQPLTSRQREVLALLSRGLSNIQIANHLCISVSTVKFHVASIGEKLGVKGRAQTIVRAYDKNLVPRQIPESGRAVAPHASLRRVHL